MPRRRRFRCGPPTRRPPVEEPREVAGVPILLSRTGDAGFWRRPGTGQKSGPFPTPASTLANAKYVLSGREPSA
jgi:hypothetical protein